MLIIGNGRLVTRDAAQPFFENGAVAVDGERICRVGTLEEVRRALDGRWFEGALQPWTRTSCMPRKRDDGLKLYEMVFEAGIIED